MNVLITGTSSGFGYLTAIELARRGQRVFASMRAPDGRNAESARRLRDQAGPSLQVLPLDVTDEISVERAFAQLSDQGVELDVLVNNAGVAAGGVTESFTAADANRIFDVNVFGTLRTTRAALPGMRAQRRGLVINVGSTMGREVVPFLALYEASKFALEGLWEAWRYELGIHGIEVVLVQPGTFPTTGMATRLLPPSDPTRADGYEALLPKIDRFFDDLDGYARSGGAPDPMLVARAIADTIELPAGARPFRLLLDPNGSGAAARMNTLAAVEQRALLSHLGLEELDHSFGVMP